MYELVAHPAAPPLAVTRVTAKAGVETGWLQLRWRVEGTAKLVLPAFAGRGRRDGLWRATCFEIFAQSEGGANYSEYNFSPSEAWAAYDFTGRREGMAERPMSRDPVLMPRLVASVFILDASIPLRDLPALPLALGISAVIEEEGGALSYWALRHGREDRPDFHDPACFAMHLEPPAAR